MIILLLVHSYTELAPDIILEIVFVTVEMVFSNIGQDSDIRSEINDVIQLKAAHLHYIKCFGIHCHLASKGLLAMTTADWSRSWSGCSGRPWRSRNAGAAHTTRLTLPTRAA